MKKDQLESLMQQHILIDQQFRNKLNRQCENCRQLLVQTIMGDSLLCIYCARRQKKAVVMLSSLDLSPAQVVTRLSQQSTSNKMRTAIEDMFAEKIKKLEACKERVLAGLPQEGISDECLAVLQCLYEAKVYVAEARTLNQLVAGVHKLQEGCSLFDQAAGVLQQGEMAERMEAIKEILRQQLKALSP